MEKVNVTIKSKDEYNWLMTYLSKKGYTWEDGEGLFDWTPVDKVAYILIDSVLECITYGTSLSLVKDNCITLKEYKEVVDMFTKDDLEVGMLVIDRKGDNYIVMPSKKNGIVLINEEGMFTELRTYKDNLTDNYIVINKELDILRVYDLPTSTEYGLSFNTSYRKLLWERKEEEIKELTMEELEEQYGCKVKIVKNR